MRQPEVLRARGVRDAAVRAVGRGPDQGKLRAALEWAKGAHCHIVVFDDDRYPPLLREIPDPPLVLYARGRIEVLESPAIAIVGSRNATAQGARNAMEFARALGDAGLSIVSGLAQGIDAAAHRGAIQSSGSTIAVLGTGIDRVYPAGHKSLAATVSEHGLLLTEFPVGTAPMAANFPRRNRVISGIARGCLVVEAALASGSLITARQAAEQGRDVFAIPGSIHAPLSRGCHDLIKQGAKLVECAQDVLDELGPTWRSRPVSERLVDAPALPADARRLLDALGYDPSDPDSLAQELGLAVEEISALLLELELAGQVEMLAGNRVQRIN